MIRFLSVQLERPALKGDLARLYSEPNGGGAGWPISLREKRFSSASKQYLLAEVVIENCLQGLVVEVVSSPRVDDIC